jgi:hypothetical protein
MVQIDHKNADNQISQEVSFFVTVFFHTFFRKKVCPPERQRKKNNSG